MQNCFLIVPLAIMCYLSYNVILYKKNSPPKPKTNLLLYGIILLLIWAFQLLNIYNFISDDFSYNSVYKYSEKSTHWIYKITSSFSNKTGAFLLWLTCIASVGFAFTCKINKIFAKSQFVYLLQAVSISIPLLLATMLFFTDAFAQTTAITHSNGIGFKPILYSKYNLFHAPLLFAGFAFYYHNYVIAICSLFSRNDITTSQVPTLKPLQKAVAQSRAQSGSLRLLCHYNKLGLLLLFCGTLLGSMWAYNSFGWGGFWNWDPIENAALMPLLLSFALLLAFELFHSEPSQKLFKLILLIPLIIFPMLLLCTFVARGGASLTAAIQSVHSYAETNHIELLFILALLLLILIGSMLLFIIKFRKIASRPTHNSKFNFKVNFNLKTIALLEITTLFGIAFVVLVGTLMPLFAGLLGFEAETLSSNFYVMWCQPLVSVFLILSSIKALANKSELREIKLSPKIIFTFAFALFAIVLAWFYGVSQPADLLLIFACSSAFASHLLALLWRVLPVGSILRYIGIAIFAVAALLQSHYTTEEKVILIENQKLEVKPKITCIFTKIKEEKLSNSNMKVTANVSVFVQNAELSLQPHFIVSEDNIISHHFPDYTRGGIADIYIQPLACYENNGGNLVLVATIITKPFMVFVWVGGLVVLVGLLLFPVKHTCRTCLHGHVGKENSSKKH